MTVALPFPPSTYIFSDAFTSPRILTQPRRLRTHVGTLARASAMGLIAVSTTAWTAEASQRVQGLQPSHSVPARDVSLNASRFAQADSPARSTTLLSTALKVYEDGLDARARGDLVTASLAFEQALMLNPDFAGAWFDYGISLCDLGDPVGCKNILDTAIQQFGLPPALRQTLGQTLRVQRGELSVGLGASTNLVRATGVDSLTILLDGIPVRAFLDDRYRARGGGYSEASFSWAAQWPLNNLGARVELLGRRPFERKLPDLVSGYAELGYAIHPRTRVGALALGVDEGYLGAITSGGVWGEHQFGPGGTVMRFALERRKPKSQAGWTTARLLTRVPVGDATSVQFTLEHDFTQKQRAGEAQSRFGVDLRSSFSLPQIGDRTPRLNVGLGALHARDKEPYSPLFGDTRNRRTRIHANAAIGINLNRNWRISFDVQAARQRADIDLFDYSEVSGQLSLIYLFN